MSDTEQPVLPLGEKSHLKEGSINGMKAHPKESAVSGLDGIVTPTSSASMSPVRRKRMRKPKCLSSPAEFKGCIIRNFLPIGLAVAIVVGIAFPSAGNTANEPEAGDYGHAFPTALVCGIFIISGLSLQTDEIKKATSTTGRKGLIFGLLSILVFTPLVGFVAIQLPLARVEFSYGLAIFCAVPTTLASGVSMVTQSGGNGALALLLTVVTNLTAVVTVPFWLSAMFKTKSSDTEGATIDPVSLLLKLLVTVLAPLVLGKLLRDLFPPVRRTVKKYKVYFGLCNNLFLTLIVWCTISGASEDLLSVPPGDIIVVLVSAVCLHLIYLSFNWPICSRILHLEPAEFKAVVIMSSQKTLPLSVTIISYLTALGVEGFMTVPCIVGHMSQLFIDALLQTKWIAQMAKEKALAERAAAETAATSDTEDPTGVEIHNVGGSSSSLNGEHPLAPV